MNVEREMELVLVINAAAKSNWCDFM